ncbi:hypothetical protein CK203_058474 [Vitis vinifera]|uniref:Reverse transcriptase Ty1/copia-type domain-containing protein n=1 Tax=Vitis vinifera TaxID=29760 RepID=A0A438H0S3_VITVI|nr:hypothetical protein CK203_058474 [Vitis vinifera]
MGKLQIEDRRPQEEIGEDPKKEESPLALPPPQQEQGESSQDLPKDWKFVINHPQDQIIEFSKCMHSEFEMSMMGELNFFLGLQIKQLKEGTFINQAKYIRDILKRFNMEEAKTMKTPMSSSIKHDKDEKGKSIDSTMYRGMIGLHMDLVAPIISTVTGVEIQLDPKSIFCILDIAPVGLKVRPEDGQPLSHNLTVSSEVLHHMICSILLPRGEHLDEVSYLEAFLVNSILMGKWIHVGYLMMMHMISCCENTTRVLSYGRFLIRVFKDVGVDLSRETNFEAPKSRETTSTSLRTGTSASRSRGGGRDMRDGGWSRPLERLSTKRARA